MKATAESLDKLSEAQASSALDLLDRAFGDDVYSSNTRSAFLQGYQSEHPNAVLLHADRDLVGIAVVGRRNIGLAGTRIDALTVGPLAIEPRLQGGGLSALLMGGIDELASDLGASAIYLVGIPDFYQRYGYYPLLSRSKVTIKTDATPSCHGVEVHPFSEQFLPEMMNLFRLNAQMYSCASNRTESDWEWLTRYACNSYYFYNPHVVVADHHVVGYFCTDSRMPGRIREALHGIEDTAIRSFLRGLNLYFSGQAPSTLEIMTPANSPLHEYLRRGSDATFSEIIQSHGGQLLKVCDLDQLLGRVRAADKEAGRGEGPQQYRRPGPSPGAELHDWAPSTQAETPLPGLLSGYVRRGMVERHDADGGAHETAFISRSRGQTPFIYQGDNY